MFILFSYWGQAGLKGQEALAMICANCSRVLWGDPPGSLPTPRRHPSFYSRYRPASRAGFFVVFCLGIWASPMHTVAKQDEIQTEPAPSDAFTIVSIAIVAYIFATMLHEAVGHGGACLLVGGKPLVISTVHMECSVESRLVMAAGTLMNVAAGALCFALGRITAHPRLRYFLWLSMTLNLFIAAGYFAFSGIGGFGDWALFIQGLGPQWVWRIGMAIFGAAAYMLVARFSLLELRPLIGSDRKQRYVRAVGLTKLPYFAGGILACVAGALNPQGLILVVLSAAASTFGGTSGLLWMIDWLNGDRIPLGLEPEPMPIERSWPWIATAGMLAVVFVVVIGPGVRFAGR